MSDDPTPAELWRRLEDVLRRFEDVAKDVREFRNWAERLYVPRMEWVEARKVFDERIGNVAGRVKDLEDDSDDNRTFRRQVLLALSVAAFSAFVAVTIAVAGLVLGKGP